MRMHHLGLLICALALAAPSAFAQRMNKCKDGNGKITYSDQLCPSVAGLSETPKGAQANKASGGKLTEANVAAVLRYAMDLTETSDYRGQCALAAPDLSFNLTEYTRTPPIVLSGGKAELCELQRVATQRMDQGLVRMKIKLGKLAITPNADGTRASIAYEFVNTLTQHGQTLMQLRCVREDQLGLYGDRILFARAVSVCKAL